MWAKVYVFSYERVFWFFGMDGNSSSSGHWNCSSGCGCWFDYIFSYPETKKVTVLIPTREIPFRAALLGVPLTKTL